MTKLIELEQDETIKVSSNVLKYLKPNVIYVPFNDAKALVNINEIVDIGTPLFKTSSLIITSPISGKTKSFKPISTINGQKYALEILNDFEERKRLEPIKKISLNNIKKEALEKLLYTQFNLDFKDKNILILNAIDDNIYANTSSFYLLLNYEGFLEILDKFFKIFTLDKIIICLKETSSENINKLMECLGMYPNIELRILPNLYLLGTNSILLKYLNIPISNSLVLKTNTLYDIYNLIKRNRQKTDKLITISGNGLKNPSIIQVKIGAPLKSIITDLIELKDTDVEYIAGNLLSGKVIDINNFIVDEALDSILIMKKKSPTSEKACIQCGQCLNICPVNINPLLLSNTKYKNQVKDICLKCGLCSYICPAYINFNKYLEGEQNV